MSLVPLGPRWQREVGIKSPPEKGLGSRSREVPGCEVAPGAHGRVPVVWPFLIMVASCRSQERGLPFEPGTVGLGSPAGRVIPGRPGIRHRACPTWNAAR